MEALDDIREEICTYAFSAQYLQNPVPEDSCHLRLDRILFDERTPIHCDKDARDDYAQTLATGVFQLHPDRVEWTVHAGPDERAALNGSVSIAPAA